MIFTTQCLVSRYNFAKIEPISNGNRTEWSPIRSVIIRVINKIGRPRSAFWNKMYSLVKNTKYSFQKQRRNRVRVDVLLTPCSPGRNRAKHRDSREIKTKTSFTRFGTNSSTDCSTFCMSLWKFLHSFSIGMAFLNDSSGLH